MALQDELTSEELLALDKMESDLFKEGSKDTPPALLFHYTSSAGLDGILKSKEIWATHFRYLNDAGELTYGEELALELANDLLQGPKELGVRTFLEMFVEHFATMRLSEIGAIYVASFSENADQLSQWRAYGSDNSGYAIGFSRLPEPTNDSPDAIIGLSLYKCTYDTDRFRTRTRALFAELAKGFDKYLAIHASREKAARALLATALGICWRRLVVEVFRLKSPGFYEEQEWRLVVVPSRGPTPKLVRCRLSPQGLVPYIPIRLVENESDLLPLGTVTVGPGDNAQLAKMSCEVLLEVAGYSPDIVKMSAIPYRRFR
ncbi:MAG TPA: DUF2971 domain-containing protein [Polyangia bacterium]|jgi:hypothetical protein